LKACDVCEHLKSKTLMYGHRSRNIFREGKRGTERKEKKKRGSRDETCVVVNALIGLVSVLAELSGGVSVKLHSCIAVQSISHNFLM